MYKNVGCLAWEFTKTKNKQAIKADINNQVPGASGLKNTPAYRRHIKRRWTAWSGCWWIVRALASAALYKTFSYFIRSKKIHCIPHWLMDYCPFALSCRWSHGLMKRYLESHTTHRSVSYVKTNPKPLTCLQNVTWFIYNILSNDHLSSTKVILNWYKQKFTIFDMSK